MATPGLKRGWEGPSVTMTRLTYSQRSGPAWRPRLFQHLPREHPAQVVAVQPLHFHDADAVLGEEIVDGKQIVVLDQGDARGHPRHPVHVFLVGLCARVRLGRVDLEGHRQGEAVGPLAFAEVDDALAAGAE